MSRLAVWAAAREVQQGRVLAQALRVPVPDGLAERVRASVAGSGLTPVPAPSRPGRRQAAMPPRQAGIARRLGVAATAAGLLVTGTAMIRDDPHRDPAVIAAVVRLAHGSGPNGTVARSGALHGITVTRSRIGGSVVVVARRSAPFPMPAGAHPIPVPAGAHPMGQGSSDPWVATRGGLVLVCINGRHPVLAVGRVPVAQLMEAADA